MCLLLREAMNVGRIAISPFFFSVELEKLEARKRIKDELLNYCVVTEAPKTTFGKVRKTYTGKLYGKQDDLAIAIQLAMIGCQKFFQGNNTHPNPLLTYTTCLPSGLMPVRRSQVSQLPSRCAYH